MLTIRKEVLGNYREVAANESSGAPLLISWYATTRHGKLRGKISPPAISYLRTNGYSTHKSSNLYAEQLQITREVLGSGAIKPA